MVGEFCVYLCWVFSPRPPLGRFMTKWPHGLGTNEGKREITRRGDFLGMVKCCCTTLFWDVFSSTVWFWAQGSNPLSCWSTETLVLPSELSCIVTLGGFQQRTGANRWFWCLGCWEEDAFLVSVSHTVSEGHVLPHWQYCCASNLAVVMSHRSQFLCWGGAKAAKVWEVSGWAAAQDHGALRTSSEDAFRGAGAIPELADPNWLWGNSDVVFPKSMVQRESLRSPLSCREPGWAPQHPRCWFTLPLQPGFSAGVKLGAALPVSKAGPVKPLHPGKVAASPTSILTSVPPSPPASPQPGLWKLWVWVWAERFVFSPSLFLLMANARYSTGLLKYHQTVFHTETQQCFVSWLLLFHLR